MSNLDTIRLILVKYVLAFLGLGPDFFESTYDDIPTDQDKLRIGSDVDSNTDDDGDYPLALEDAGGDDAMED